MSTIAVEEIDINAAAHAVFLYRRDPWIHVATIDGQEFHSEQGIVHYHQCLVEHQPHIAASFLDHVLSIFRSCPGHA